MTNNLRIAICGAPGTGKTDLAKKISEKLTLPLIHQGSKEVKHLSFLNYPLNRKMNEVQRLQYQIELINYRFEQEKNYADYVTDGCSIDFLVWYRFCSFLAPLDQKLSTEALLWQSVQNYTHIFYLPLYEAPDILVDDPEASDAFNIETADFLTKGTVAKALHRGLKVWIIQTPKQITPETAGISADEAALSKRVEEVLQVVNPQTPSIQ
jgi:hypothetical protein